MFLCQLQKSCSWTHSLCLEGEGEREVLDRDPTQGRTVPVLLAAEVTRCVVVLGPPGPPARCVEIVQLCQEGLETRGWACSCEGGRGLSTPS